MDFRAPASLIYTDSAQWSVVMAFIIDKEKLKSGLIIFRRGDVAHRNFYCRIKLPKEDRYKTIALRTTDKQSAIDQAFDLDADIRFRIKHDVPVFNRPFRQVAEEYIAVLQRRAKLGEVSADSVKNVANRCRRVLGDYVCSTQIHLIGQDRWTDYPSWRRETGKGRSRDIVSDATIGVEMGAFNAVMSFAISKRYVPASHRFEGKPKLKTMRRDEFTTEEYASCTASVENGSRRRHRRRASGNAKFATISCSSCATPGCGHRRPGTCAGETSRLRRTGTDAKSS
jgi:hypothetical protein